MPPNQLQSKNLLQSQGQKENQKVKLKQKAKLGLLLTTMMQIQKTNLVTLWDCSRWNSKASPVCKTSRIVEKKYKKQCTFPIPC